MNRTQFNKILGQKIREMREHREMTQEQVATFGIDVKQYQRIERGLVNPTAYTLLILSKAFKCSVDKLMP